MRKVFAVLFFAAMAAFPAAARAEGAAMAGEPMTWSYLASIAGATAATMVIVQYLKIPLDRVWKIPTRAFVYVVALVVLGLATAFTAGLTWESAPLVAMNAFVVALSAYGGYELTFAKAEK